ncbi:MAG: C4-type zinc ribbon domain-containing protein [Planctomycetota bacterium]
MRQTLRLLQGLQELDRDLYRVKDELRRLPEELERRRSRIDGDIARRAEMDGALRLLGTRIKEIEDLTSSQRQRVRKLESEAATSRADTALIVAYQHEIRSLKREISEAESEGLGLVEEAETLNAEREALRASIAAAEEEFAGYAENLRGEIRVAESRRRELEGERARRMGGGSIAPDILATYEKLLEAREGQAMVTLEDRTCQGCYVSVPTNIYVRLARGLDLVCCPSCGRVLFLPALLED